MLLLAGCYVILSAFIVFMTIMFVDLETHWFDNGTRMRNWTSIMFIISVIIVIPAIFLATIPDTVAYNQRQIVSLNDNVGLYGTFFLGSGTVESVSRYYFYEKVGTGYKQGSIPTISTIIFMDENSNPYVMSKYVNGYPESYEIHVPNNTIIRDYKLNGM